MANTRRHSWRYLQGDRPQPRTTDTRTMAFRKNRFVACFLHPALPGDDPSRGCALSPRQPSWPIPRGRKMKKPRWERSFFHANPLP